MTLGNLNLLLCQIATHLNQLHTVKKWGRDGRDVIGSGDEHHLGEVERDLEVMVGEDEVVVARIGFVGVEVGEHGGNVAGAGASGDAVDGVVGAGIGDARGAVFLEVAARLVA